MVLFLTNDSFESILEDDTDFYLRSGEYCWHIPKDIFSRQSAVLATQIERLEAINQVIFRYFL